MDIYSKRAKRFEINSVSELEQFIINTNLKKYFIKFPDNIVDTILLDIKSTPRINIKKLKMQFISKYMKCGTNFKIEYWLERGYDMHTAGEKVSEMQSANANIFKQKRIGSPTDYIAYMPNQLGYWIKRGYSPEQSALLVSERQHTFSKEKLLKKYDEQTTMNLLSERNHKWFTSLKKNNNWDEMSYKKGNNGLNTIKTLNDHIKYYGEMVGKIKFAKRYWGITISKVSEFDTYQEFIAGERTALFYNKEYRTAILSEQSHKCGECGKSNTEVVMHLHHIDYDKKNDTRQNLIFLCNSCHSATTNSKRAYYIEYYKNRNKLYYEETI